MLVTVDTVHTPASGMSTIVTASGLDEKGRRVTFAGDHRPMSGLAEAVEYEGEVEVELESWQILSIVEPDVVSVEEPTQADPGQIPMFEVVAEVEVPRG